MRESTACQNTHDSLRTVLFLIRLLWMKHKRNLSPHAMTQRGVMFGTMHAMTRSFKCDVYCPITRLLAHPMLCIVVTMDDGHKYRPGVWQENFPLGPASVSWPHLPGLDYWGGAIGRRKGSCYRRKQLKLFGLFVMNLEQYILFVLISV